MSKLAARLFFCVIPAMLVGLLGCLADAGIGLIFFIAMFGLGWQVTEAKPERGEGLEDV